MANEGYPQQLPYALGQNTGDEAKLKDQIINPTRRENSKFGYFKTLSRDLKLTNVPEGERDYWQNVVRLTKELSNLYMYIGLDEMEEMLTSEFFTEWNALASEKGWQTRNLGQTTGYGRQEITQTPEPKAIK